MKEKQLDPIKTFRAQWAVMTFYERFEQVVAVIEEADWILYGRVIEELSVRGCAAAVDGSDVVRASAVGSVADAESLGRSVARELLDLGARDLVEVTGVPDHGVTVRDLFASHHISPTESDPHEPEQLYIIDPA